MLVKMRNAAQSWIAKFVAGVIIVVLVLFGFGAFNLFTVNEPIVASVDGVDITESRLVAEVENTKRTFRETYGEQITEDQLNQWIDNEYALRRLIDTQLFTNATQALGLRLSDKKFQQSIQDNPVFQTDGEFNEQVFRETLQRSGLSAQSLRELEEDSDVRQQLLGLLETTSFATTREMKMSAKFNEQTRDFSTLAFKVASFENPEVITEEEIKEEYELNQDLYMTNGEFDFEYIQLKKDKYTPETEPTEEEVQELYDNEVAAKNSSAKRRASHILFNVDENRTSEEALEEATKVSDRLADGEDFAELAKELSEDFGSGSNGGDLGFATRSTYVKPFADKVWSLEVGEISEPVETTFGYHIIQLNEIEEVEHQPLDEVREDLVARYMDELALEALAEQASNVDKLAFENPESLLPLAEEYDLAIEILEGVDAFSTEGVLTQVAVGDALFDTDVIDNNFNSRVVTQSDSSLLVGRLLDRRPPTLRPLDDVKDEIRDMLVLELAEAERDQAMASALDLLHENQDYDEAASLAKEGDWQVYEAQVREDFTVDPAVLAEAFNVALPENGDRVFTEAESEFASDKFILVVSSQKLAEFNLLDQTKQEALTAQSKDNVQTRVLSSFVAGLRSEASIKSELVNLD